MVETSLVQMTWLPIWQHFLLGEFFEGSWVTSKPRTRNLTPRDWQKLETVQAHFTLDLEGLGDQINLNE